MPSLGSQDNVEDAANLMHESTLPFILITGTHTDYSRLDSNLSQAARDMLLDWVRSGHFEKMLLDHFQQNPTRD